MKKTLIYIFCFLVIAHFSMVNAHAQRTANGEMQASLVVGTTFSSFGGEALMGAYTLNGQWFAGLDFFNRKEFDIPTSEYVNMTHLHFVGGYMYRIYGSLSRNFNVYGGGDAFLGMEFFDLFHTMSEPARKGYGAKDVIFNYGFSIRAEAEYFFSDVWALVLRGRMPFIFNSKFPVLGYEISLGVKYNF